MSNILRSFSANRVNTRDSAATLLDQWHLSACDQ